MICNALLQMASEKKVDKITCMMTVLKNAQDCDETDFIEIELENLFSIENQSEGIKDLNGSQKDELWDHLGLPEKKHFFFTISQILVGLLIHGVKMARNCYRKNLMPVIF